MSSARAERTWTPVELIRWTAEYLAGKGIEEPRLTAELLLAGTLGLKRLDLYLQFERPLTPEELAEFKIRLKRRLRGEPLQYIAGTAEFRNLELRVDSRVLIPRPETERLVGEVLNWAAARPGLDVVDIGTGSGAIALALRQEGNFGRVVATDISVEALALAKSNAELAVPGGVVEFRPGAGYEAVRGERFDVIVSNPPYVAEIDRDGLPAEVRDWEPQDALFGGEDGLDVIRRLVAGAAEHLTPGGLLALEIGADQAAAVARLVRSEPTFKHAIVKQDLAARDRVVLAEIA